MCPGSHIAISLLGLTVAGMLSTFNISKAVDQDGSLIETEVEYQTGMVW